MRSISVSLKSRLKKLYSVPVIGYLVRLGVALVRLPDSESYHAALLKSLDERLHEQARLLAEATRLLEEQRASRAVGIVDLERRFDDLSHLVHASLADILNSWTIQQAMAPQAQPVNSHGEEGISGNSNLQRKVTVDHLNQALSQLQQEVNDIHQEIWARTGALEAELAKRGVELERAADHLANRIEFVRRETLFELRYGEAPYPSADLKAEARIVNPEKLSNVPEGSYRLNVGCGHIPLDGYINVDRRDLPSVDVVAEAGDMPFEEESLAEVFSAHLLEHFPQEQLRREILPYWRSLLRPGGVLRAVVPDAASMIRGYDDGSVSYEDLREVTYGAQDYDGDFHFNMFTPDSLAQLLEESGFVEIDCPVTGRRNGRCFEFEIVATKPDDPSIGRVEASDSQPA